MTAIPWWNVHLFLLLNAAGDPPGRAIGCARLVANSPDLIVPAILLGLWIWGCPARRGALIAVAGGVLAGLGINQILGLAWFEPRPFMAGLGHTWLPHAPDNGFPSDHATFVWSLGAGLVITGASRSWGGAACAYGAVVGWSRVYLGVHFPIDILTALPVALAAGGLARLARPVVAAWILPVADGLYEGTLDVLRLPAALFPRKARPSD